MIRKSRHAACILSAACLLFSGCTEEDTSAFVQAAMDVYDSVSQSSVDVKTDVWYYPYRYDLWHGSYAGECAVLLGDGFPGFSVRDMSQSSLYTGPVSVTGYGGRTESVFSVLGSDFAEVSVTIPGNGDVPGIGRSRAYTGIVDGDVLRAVSGVPGGSGPYFLATCYAWKAGLSPLYDEIESYVSGHEGVKALCRVTAVYDGRNLMPDGFLFEAYALDGGLSRCMYVYNVQPGIAFDYATGENWIEAAGAPD